MTAGKPVMFNDVKRVWERFVQVKRDASLNHPDTWNASTAAAAQPVAQPVAASTHVVPYASHVAAPLAGGGGAPASAAEALEGAAVDVGGPEA